MKTYVLMFQELTGEWVSVYHVAVVSRKHYRFAIRYAMDCLLAGKCDGRYVGNRCVVYSTDDHAMWELVCKDGLVEVIC